MRTFAHVIAPFSAPPESELDVAQRITVETMRRARDCARGGVAVDLLAAVFRGDDAAVPREFRPTAPLLRTIGDLKTFRVPRRLPLLKDILDAGTAATDAEYVIYTNVDISLQPHFYLAVDRFVDQGYDAFVINRRTIASSWFRVEDIPLMWSDLGGRHPGFDCFVFRRDAYAGFALGNVCLGMSHVDLPLVCSMIARARRFRVFRDEHLTFHIGDSKTWWKWKYRDYTVHNDREAAKAVREAWMRSRGGVRMPLLASLLLRCGLLHNATIVRSLCRACGHP